MTQALVSLCYSSRESHVFLCPKRHTANRGLLFDMSDHPVESVAESQFGVRYLFPYQRLVIANTLDTENPRRQLVILPTGAGKTLCFQLPAVLLPGVTIVVYPLLSLMDDQFRRASSCGIATEHLRGGQSPGERRAILQRIGAGSVRLVVTNPETLHDETVLECLRSVPVAHFVIDEAHCVSEWGDTFRPSYRELGTISRAIDPRVVTAFTATASPTVLAAVRSSLFGDEPVDTILGNPDRAEIGYSVVPVHSRSHALRVIATGCAGQFAGMERPLLVFCRSRTRVETIARVLQADGGDPVGAYHAGMTADERHRVERWFLHCTTGILVATCAYGLGVDKKDIRTTIHFDLPPSVEAFLQESGRAARDHGPGESIVLFDVHQAENAQGASQTCTHSSGSVEELQRSAQARQEAMVQYCRDRGCRRDYLMNVLGSACDACFGCDVCRRRRQESEHPSVELARRHDAAAVSDVLQWVHANRRRHTWESAAWELSSHVAGPIRPALSEWTHGEIEEVLTSLLASRRIRRPRRGPWRFLLTPRSPQTIVEP